MLKPSISTIPSSYDQVVEEQLDEPFLINLLFKTFRTLQRVVLPSVAAIGHDNIGMAEMRLLLAIKKSGLQINRLADLTGSSRQYVSRKIHELEQKGYVRTLRDPADSRATLIEIDQRGRQYFNDMRVVKTKVDELTRQKLGETQMKTVVLSLELLIERIDPTGSATQEAVIGSEIGTEAEARLDRAPGP